MPKRNWRKILLVAAAGTLIVCCALAAYIFIQINQPPGKGAAAEEGYRISQPIIDALEKYHGEHARYPVALTELIPTYLSQLPERASAFQLRYSLLGESQYSLEFHYAGPGMNVC